MKDNSTCESCGATAPTEFLRDHMGICSSCNEEYISDQEDRWEFENYWRHVVTAHDLIEQGIWDEDIITCE